MDEYPHGRTRNVNEKDKDVDEDDVEMVGAKKQKTMEEILADSSDEEDDASEEREKEGEGVVANRTVMASLLQVIHLLLLFILSCRRWVAARCPGGAVSGSRSGTRS